MGMSELHLVGTTGEGSAGRRATTPVLIDPEVAGVVAWLARRKDLVEVFATAIREGIDDVLDGPRTGRWSREQLSKTEKIYVATRIEILTRAALGLERTGSLATIIEGTEVGLKWSFTSRWTIPAEAVGSVCLLIGGQGDRFFSVGVLRASNVFLNPGRNRDGKRTLTREAKQSITWLVERAPTPSNFIADLPAEIRQYIFDGTSGQERVRRLFNKVIATPIPRLAVATVAQQLDPMRRVRADRARSLGRIQVYSGRYGNAELERQGYPAIGPDEFISVPLARNTRITSDE